MLKKNNIKKKNLQAIQITLFKKQRTTLEKKSITNKYNTNYCTVYFNLVM